MKPFVVVIAAIVILFLASPGAFAADNEWAYVTPHVLKVAAAVVFDSVVVGALVANHGYALDTDIALMAAVSLVGVPSAFIVGGLAAGDAESVKTWRTVSIFTDAMASLALGALGFAWRYSWGARWGSASLISAGAGIAFFISGSFLADMLMDTTPFAVENAPAGP
jgi:hypothetical protein